MSSSSNLYRLFPKAKTFLSLLLLFSFLANPALAQTASPEAPAEEVPAGTLPSPSDPVPAVTVYSLTYTAGANGSLSGSLSQSVEAGQDGTAVTAVADTGYEFSVWSDGQTENPRTDTAVAADLSVEASFVAIPPVVEEAPVVVPEPEEAPAEEVVAPAAEEVSYAQDYELYKKYLLFQKYEKREMYKKYLRYRELAGKYPWEASKKTEKKILKKLKSDSKKYRKKPSQYPHLAARHSDYANYAGLKAEYFRVKPFAGCGDYIRYDRDEYAAYGDYGTDEYRLGYERYAKAIADGLVPAVADTEIDTSALGPEITVGLFSYIPKDLEENSFSIKADKPFKVVTRKDEVLGTVAADTKIRVKLDKLQNGDNKRFFVYYSGSNIDIGDTSKEVRFVAADEGETDIVFDTSLPGTDYDRYRDSIRLKYYDSDAADGDRVWVINALPLEHYVWGMGEITGTGPEEYNRVMTTVFRTYGYWKIKWSTKYAAQGFKVDATSGSQIYRGYDWEVTHDSIKKAAEASRSTLVMYDGEVALTPYSSWTDGHTRRYEDGHWGHQCDTNEKKTSSIYPWLSSVSDERGKHDTLGTCELASRGNHMVGLSANGAVRQAKLDNKGYLEILAHYYKGVNLTKAY